QDHRRIEPEVRDQAAQHLYALLAPRGGRGYRLITVGADLVFDRYESPAMRAHAARIHQHHHTLPVCYNRFSAMVKTERELREDICQIGRLVFQKGWVAANDGNITIRLDAERILATPTGTCKGMMQCDDLIIVDMQGNKIQGRAERTSEIAMHTTVYGLRPDIRSVVHAHPPVATGFATAGKPLNLALLPEVVIGLGCVPLASYGLPGTPALTEGMLPLIPKYDAL